jgi:hypothetical protein
MRGVACPPARCQREEQAQSKETARH